MKEKVLSIISPIIAIFLALIVVGVVVICSDQNPLEAYAALLKGSFGSVSNFMSTVRYTIPILLLAISFSICERGGYFNIGQEGQMFMAALTAVAVNDSLRELPKPLLLLVTIMAGVLVSAIISVIPAVLKFYFGINEAILLVMMNYIIELLVTYLMLYSRLADSQAAAMPKSIPLSVSISAPVLYIFTIFIFIGFTAVMKYSVLGYRIRITGKNAAFAKACGIPAARTFLSSALIGGGIAGVAGLFEVLGIYHVMFSNFAIGMGFMGITAALLGRHSPLGMMLGSLVLGALQSGSVMLSTITDVSPEIVQVVQGFVMFFATVSFLYVWKKKKSHLRKSGRNPL
ncbi:ABC transporter permease [Diplocloster modestus]|uniref:ABC transporter permease n=1 Tax=Diplocloster modestus TaxID=2850322 RepID=A0ABS6K9L6_9FIRM|nr:ABC transporter permease [Diplocloster modestus]MBU9727206.1 ABC transporter permease [Diplocloster modestus]